MATEPHVPSSIRAPHLVAQRCLALLAVIARAHDDSDVTAWAVSHGIEKYLSAREAEFFHRGTQTQQERINFSWRVEAMVPLLWALKHLPAIPSANVMFDAADVIERAKMWQAPSAFVSTAKLRPDDEILDAREVVYEANWTVRDARLFSKSVPSSLNPGIVQERHHALNWLVGDSGDDWDRVTTDT